MSASADAAPLDNARARSVDRCTRSRGLPSNALDRGALAVLRDECVELGLDVGLLFALDAVDEADAVQVVVLVLKDAGRPSNKLLLEGPAGGRHRFDFDPFRSGDVAVDIGKREAALGAGHLALGLGHNLRVHQDYLVEPLVFVARGVEDHQALVDADLRRGETDALGLVHELEHAPAERLRRRDFVVGDDLVWRSEGGVRVHDDAQPRDETRVDLFLDRGGGEGGESRRASPQAACERPS
mmetsp:Transcript_31479/g.105989  ORF Transcript_31479/g.105989 Transcript_31479/m.105989 type:complete len:241 (-) Transcript_31479:30-752(-)